MGILDKIGFKKAGKQKPEEEPVSSQQKQETVLQPQPKKEEKTRTTKAGRSQAYRFLLRPILSEKANMLASSGKYVFAVTPKANKNEVKKGIEDVYNVHVENVRMVTMPSKQRRYGRSVGRTSSWKKAIVKLKKGEKISGIIESIG